jgi:predicted Zn finger-like uncharacterized protein
MHIHCPHCRSPIEVVDDQELRDVTCPSCGSSFNLLPDETVTRIAKEYKKLGHFELIDRIGVGTFGEVWTAHDSELDRTVAIKLPRKGQLAAKIEAFQGFADDVVYAHFAKVMTSFQRCRQWCREAPILVPFNSPRRRYRLHRFAL